MHGAEQDVVPAEGTWQWASLHMADRPVEAEAALAASSSADAKYQHALFLFFFRPASVERDERIRRDMGLYLTALQRTWKQGNSEFDFDKNPELASRLSVGQLMAGRIYTDVVPCALLVKVPSWVEITEPAFGSTRDYFLPRSGCSVHDSLMAGFPYADLESFRELSNAAARPFEGGGSIRYTLFTSQLSTGYWMQFDPRRFDLGTTPAVAIPYQTWGYLSLSNQALYRQVAALYPKLKAQLAIFYGRFGLTGAAAGRAADAGLYNYAFGPDCGGAPPPQSFHKLLLDGTGLDEIKNFAGSALWRSKDDLAAYRICGHPDPLAHIAIVDMRAFAYLQGLSKTLSTQEQVDLDLVMEVGAANIFGKTPLMSAAQHDQLEAVRWLIANGADVNSVTDSTSLLFGRRTALMYAAASGSLPVISTLIDSGADPHQTDTMGKSAVDYLLGVGPESEPPNPLLTDVEFSAAYELLR